MLKQTNIDNLSNQIPNVGNQVVNCTQNCQGIINDKKSGRIPRCIFFDLQGSSKTTGCIIVGINPGIMKSGSEEQKHYLKNKGHLTYQTIFKFWNLGEKEHNYYKFLRNLVNKIGYDGPILWTELVKCEKRNRNTPIPLQTFRICTNKFLSKEIDKVPPEWPIIAVGREAHKAISYLYPTRSVLGVPHPTSSRGHFNRLYVKNKFGKQFKKIVDQKIQIFLKNKGIEIWLSDKKQ